MSTRSRQGFTALLTLLITVLFGFFAGPAMARSEQGDAHAKNGDAGQEEAIVTEDGDDNDQFKNCDDAGVESQHPSGKDRYCESGASGNQGASTSHPDDTNGPERWEGLAQEPDKPGGDANEGGEYLSDQDGNNGCGNDQDFDDDNNGWCGKPEEPEVQRTTTEVKSTETVSPVVADAAQLAASEATVLGVVFERPAEVAPAATAPQVGLARTGSPIVAIAILGAFLLAMGVIARRFARSAA